MLILQVRRGWSSLRVKVRWPRKLLILISHCLLWVRLLKPCLIGRLRRPIFPIGIQSWPCCWWTPWGGPPRRWWSPVPVLLPFILMRPLVPLTMPLGLWILRINPSFRWRRKIRLFMALFVRGICSGLRMIISGLRSRRPPRGKQWYLRFPRWGWLRRIFLHYLRAWKQLRINPCPCKNNPIPSRWRNPR